MAKGQYHASFGMSIGNAKAMGEARDRNFSRFSAVKYRAK